MGQSQTDSRSDGAADTVITNALIVDHTGIIQSRHVGLKDGRIAEASARQAIPIRNPMWIL